MVGASVCCAGLATAGPAFAMASRVGGQRAAGAAARLACRRAPAAAAAVATASPSSSLRFSTSARARRASPTRPGTAAQQPQQQPQQQHRPLGPRRTRAYHSYDRPAPAGEFSAVEQAILAAASRHIPEHGFTAEALSRGARDAGYRDVSVNVLPEGVFSLIRWHLVTQREALAGKVRSGELWGGEEEARLLGVGEKVERLVWARLMGSSDIIGRWQEALAVMAQPSYVPASVKELALLADEIWFLAGDVSVDPSWYTKRGSVAGLYATTELFMTNDTSPDFSETRQFLRRRVSEMNEVGGAVRAAGQWLGYTASATVNVLRSKGLVI